MGLPGLLPSRPVLHEGPSRTERIALLDQFMGRDRRGAYQVHVRLFDGTSGALLARASAGFEVCDTPGTLTGIVRSQAGTPFNGAGARLALVHAIDVLRAAEVASATIDATGAYSLTLAPGRYLATATVLDAGAMHRAQSSQLVEIGCDGTAATLDLTAAAPTPFPSTTRRAAR